MADPSSGSLTGGNQGFGRRLDEAGSVTKEHPAGGMERPDKWKKSAQPSASEVSQAGDHQLLQADELRQLGEVGMRDVKLFVVEASPESFLLKYQEPFPEVRVSEKDGVKSLALPVKEGLMVVSAAPNADGKTLVCEALLSEKATITNLDFVNSLRDRAREQER